MSDDLPSPDASSLLAHSGWVRALARSLVADRHLAEDIAQESWLAASAHPPKSEGNLRAWLGRVVTNAARQRQRADRRRDRRERRAASARPTTAPAAADVVEQAETQQQVVASVLALAEPYRRTLLLAYFQGKSASEIAKEQGVPAGTVRSRLHRGLAQLRKELTEHYQGDDAWRAALAPLALAGATGVGAVSKATAPYATGWLLMQMKSTVAVVVVAIAALSTAWIATSWILDASEPPAAPGTSAVLAGTESEADVATGAPTGPAGAAARQPALASATMTGRVRAPDGGPVANAVVDVVDPSAPGRLVHGSATSRADGTFAVALATAPGEEVRCEVSAKGFYPGTMTVEVGDAPVEIQLAWECVLTGRVVHAESHEPVVGARVSLGVAAALTSADGRYEVAEAALDQALPIRVTKTGFLATTAEITVTGPIRSERDFELVPGESVLVTVVDDATGAPLAGAAVRASHGDEGEMARTDDAGQFPLPLVPGEGVSVRVELAGYAELWWYWSEPHTETPFTLRLLPLGWITGTVWGGDGKPIADAWVYAVQEEAPLGRFATFSDTTGIHRIEFPRAGLLRPPEGFDVDRLIRNVLAREMHDYVSVEREASTLGLPGRLSPCIGTTTDAEGHFALPVPPKETPYLLHAGGEGLVSVQSPPVPLTYGHRNAQVDLNLVPSAAVYGRALRNDEPWQRGVVVWSHGDARGGFVQPSADGQYQLDDVPPGRVTIAARDQFGNPAGEPVSVELVAGVRTEVNLTWREAMTEIHGAVTSADGAPQAGLEVSAHPSVGYFDGSRAITDAQGHYALTVRDGRSYDVMVFREPLRWEKSGVAAGSRDVDFELPPEGALLLRITDAATGEAIVARNLYRGSTRLAWRPPGASTYDYAQGTTQPDGTLAVALPVGNVDVALDFSAIGYVPLELRSVRVTTIENATPVSVALERGLRLDLEFDAAQGLEEARREGRALFLLAESELAEVKGPFPTQQTESNVNFGGVHMWLARLGLQDRFIVLGDSGQWTATGLRPGRYTLRSYPNTVRFSPEWISVEADDVAARVTWTRR